MEPNGRPSKRKAFIDQFFPKKLKRTRNSLNDASTSSAIVTNDSNQPTAAISSQGPLPSASTSAKDDPNELSSAQSGLEYINELPPMHPAASARVDSSVDHVFGSDRAHAKETSRAEKAWSAFKGILPIVEKVSVVFPPLQSAVGGIIGVISKLEVRPATKSVVSLLLTIRVYRHPPVI